MTTTDEVSSARERANKRRAQANGQGQRRTGRTTKQINASIDQALDGIDVHHFFMTRAMCKYAYELTLHELIKRDIAFSAAEASMAFLIGSKRRQLRLHSAETTSIDAAMARVGEKFASGKRMPYKVTVDHFVTECTGKVGDE